MTTLDTARFGLPRLSTYFNSMDLALVNTEFDTFWRRQRRTYLHNASLFNLSWLLPTREAKALQDWLMSLPQGDFFWCDLLSGNNYQAKRNQIIAPVQIRRTTEVACERVPYLDKFILSFSAETLAYDSYQTFASEAANQPPATYPTNLPLPKSTGFVSAHGVRNVTRYTLIYGMNTLTLQRWLAFAGYAGTAWFYHPMVSTNVPCGLELIRYVSTFEQELVGPDSWQVTVVAESMPSTVMLTYDLPATGECTYDADVAYDDPEHPYECGGTPPPQGDFVMPSGQVVISASASGASPVTATTILKLGSDGSVAGVPGVVPAWTQWHTAPSTLPRPAVSCTEVIEFSFDDGVTWNFSSPAPGGFWMPLKDHNVWLRKTLTGTYDQSSSLAFTLNFESDVAPTPIPVTTAQSSVLMQLSIDITSGGSGPTTGNTFEDGYIYTIDPGDTVESVAAGVTFKSDGRVIGQSTNQSLGLWYDPETINAGQGLWIILSGTGGGTGPAGSQSFPPTGARLSLAADNYFTAISGATGGGSMAQVFWNGTYEVYNAQSGGVLLGSGTIILASEVSP